MWQALASSFLGGKGGYSNSATSESGATGGFINSQPDHSGWSVNIAGSGLVSQSPAGILPLLAIGGALFLAAKWLKR
jgi:hypothetical protein